MTELDMKIEELKKMVEGDENKIIFLKENILENKRTVKKLERIKAEIAEIVM